MPFVPIDDEEVKSKSKFVPIDEETPKRRVGDLSGTMASDLAKGAKHAWDRAAYGLEKLVTGSMMPEHEQELKENVPTTVAGHVGQLAGDVVMSAPLGGIGGGLLRGASALKTAGRVGIDALANAGYGALTTPEDRTTGALAGGAGSVIGAGVGRVAGGLAKATAAARNAISEGLPMTPGQASGGWLNEIEQKATSLPFIGPLIAGKRGEGRQALASVELTKAGVPGTSPNMKPSELAEHTRDYIDEVYQDAFSKLPEQTRPAVRENLISSIRNIEDNPEIAPMMMEGQIASLRKWADRRLMGGQELTPAQMKKIDAEIGAKIRKLHEKGTSEEADTIPAWEYIQDQFRSQNLPGMEAANATYRQTLPIVRELDKATLHMPTPTQLIKATKRTGQVPSETLQTAEKMLPAQTGDPGTAGRLLMGSLLAGGAGLNYLGDPYYLGSLALLGGGLGTKLGQRALMGTLPGQQATATALRRSIPMTVLEEYGRGE